METRSLPHLFALAFIMMAAWGTSALAVDCGEPVPAPKYQVGERWGWQDEKGRKWSWEVVQVEGDTAQIRWGNGDVASYDKDWIVRKVVRKNGEVLTTQGIDRYTTIGQKVLDFPLQVGKKWYYTYYFNPTIYAPRIMVLIETQFKTVACEEVSTPAGKFPALKLKLESTWRAAGVGSATKFLWYAPQVKQIVKRQYDALSNLDYREGRVTDDELIRFEVR